ncbi:hypothetical protein F5J12DRAFT_902886 [Pisolithus orientalis]|uniref:uncharacterized protein n=1 Tax=Pisolithus orientalis TaxID=936130 RepID=UPI002224F1C0|nr:uncharacterized protein F5J12DRAFT_902886 [Pisolithus orientalis]KAI6033226.1 hypothetical protein F5J12DRAFT_902886 [Pisolithus orientalis]
MLPPPKVEPLYKPTFATNSVQNTTEDDKFYYEIVTPRVVTCVAEMESLPKEVMVRFNTPGAEGEWIRASDLVKTDGSGVQVDGTFIAGDGITFTDGKHTTYYPCKRDFFVFGVTRHAWLEVKPEAATVLEEDHWLVDNHPLNYLIVERRRSQAKIHIKLEHQ